MLYAFTIIAFLFGELDALSIYISLPLEVEKSGDEDPSPSTLDCPFAEQKESAVPGLGGREETHNDPANDSKGDLWYHTFLELGEFAQELEQEEKGGIESPQPEELETDEDETDTPTESDSDDFVDVDFEIMGVEMPLLDSDLPLEASATESSSSHQMTLPSEQQEASSAVPDAKAVGEVQEQDTFIMTSLPALPTPPSALPGTRSSPRNLEVPPKTPSGKHLRLPSSTGHTGKSILSRSTSEGKSKNWFLSLTSREKIDANKKNERTTKVDVRIKKREKDRDRREKDRDRSKDREKATEKSKGKEKRRDKDKEEESRKKKEKEKTKTKDKERLRQKASLPAKSRAKEKDRDAEKTKTKSTKHAPSPPVVTSTRSSHTPPVPTSPPPPLPSVPMLSISVAHSETGGTTFEENRYITRTRAATSLTTTTEDEWGQERGKGRDCSSTEEYWKNDREGDIGPEIGVGSKGKDVELPENLLAHSDRDSERALSGTEEYAIKGNFEKLISTRPSISLRKPPAPPGLESWNEATWSETWTDTSHSESVQLDISKLRIHGARNPEQLERPTERERERESAGFGYAPNIGIIFVGPP